MENVMASKGQLLAVKDKDKKVPERILESAKKFTNKEGKTDLLDFMDDIEQLSSLNCTLEGGFRVDETEMTHLGTKIYTDWESEVNKILQSFGFKLGKWSGDLEPFERSIQAKGNGTTFTFCY